MAAVVLTSEPLVGRDLPTPRIGLPSASGHGRQRTCTPSDAQPCRLLPERRASAAAESGSGADAERRRLPGRADGYPSGPPTDPDVRNSRIRFLKQSLCYPPQSTGVLVSGLVSSQSLPWFPPGGHAARRRLPARGSLGSPFPTFHGTLRRDDCHPVPRGSLRLSLASRYLACSRGSCSPLRARDLGEAPGPRQGLWSPGPPRRACGQGDRWLSHVPEFPLGRHAPLSDPGGGLRPRPTAPRTAAFQCVQTVGYPRLDPFRGSITRPAFSLHPAPYGPLRGGTRVRY